MCQFCDLVLIRHEEAEGNRAMVLSKYHGDHSLFTPEFRSKPSANWSLTEQGFARCLALGVWLKTRLDLNNFRKVVSPSLRARETADLILPEVQWQVESLVDGRCWGGIETVPYSEWLGYCINHGLGGLPVGFRESFPNGEPMSEVYDRATLFCGNSRSNMIVVTHGEFIQMSRMVIEGLPESAYPELDLHGNHIRNGQVVWYSRRDPITRRCYTSFRFKKMFYDGFETEWLDL